MTISETMSETIIKMNPWTRGEFIKGCLHFKLETTAASLTVYTLRLFTEPSVISYVCGSAIETKELSHMHKMSESEGGWSVWAEADVEIEAIGI